MNLQGLAVIFAIILLPIVIVTSSYIDAQIDTVVLEQRYDSVLMGATHDAIKAFQLNEINSNTQNIPTEKIRDVEASISAFYTALGTGMGSSGYSEDDLKPYIPALVYTLYDGYYIYAPYDNINTADSSRDWGLKPYIYYSARYKKGTSIDVTINYTLDNYVTVYGWINDTDDIDDDGNRGHDYITHSGYLIMPDQCADDGTSYQGISIGSENLEEVDRQTVIDSIENGSSITPKKYTYVNGVQGRREKVYHRSDGTWYKYTVDGIVQNLTESELAQVAAKGETNSDAQDYFREAKEFSNWIKRTLGDLTIGDMVVNTDTQEYTAGEFFTGTNADSTRIFDLENNPESKSSNFYNHKKDVIRNSIESNLAAVIASYNASRGNTYNFKMPELTENDWEKIANHVNMITFMQGLPIKGKYYMGYSIVSNNMNAEFVDPDAIYILDTSTNTYHNIHCKAISGNLVGYRYLDFQLKQVAEVNTSYIPHNAQGDYTCTVASINMAQDKEEIFNDSSNMQTTMAYYRALARERYDSYKSTKNILSGLQ